MKNKMFLLLNKHDNTMIDEFESREDFLKEQVRFSVELYWNDVKEVVINSYKNDLSLMTDGTAITEDATIEFWLINTTGND